MTTSQTMEATLERLRQAHQMFHSNMQPPADDLKIERLRRECDRRFGLGVPGRYCHLLRVGDGVEWNSARFFGSESRPYVDYPDRILPGVLEKTAEWWRWERKLALGAIEDQLFWYDQEADEYQVYNVSDNKPYRRFKEFDELFAYAFEGRWPEGI